VTTMMTKRLHVTHPAFDMNQVLKNSILLDSVNIKILNTDYHTSLGDLSPQDIIKLLSNFDIINFVDNLFDTTSDIYNETIVLLTYISHFKKITNFSVTSKITFTDFDLISRPAEPTLWIFGCSHSHGVGLDAEEQRYANIVSEKLRMPLKLISKPGSSTEWSLRHLINSNLYPKDIVIWQLTTPERVSMYNNEILLSTTNNPYLLEVYSDEELFFNQINFLNYGISFLKGRNINFVFTSLENKNNLLCDYKKEYVKYPEYCYSPNFNVDLGNDNLHFGPLSNNNLANSLVNHVQLLYG